MCLTRTGSLGRLAQRRADPAEEHVGHVVHVGEQPALGAVNCGEADLRLEGGELGIRNAVAPADQARPLGRDLERRLAGEDAAQRGERRGIEARVGLGAQRPGRRPVGSLREDARLAVVTRSEKGCIVVDRESTRAVHAIPVERVVDTTGAGDLFAAGFLFGLARELATEDAARLGALAAAEVIQHLGARPETSLKGLAQENGLL